MSSILENSQLNKIFLIYGDIDDMFISHDLQKTNFRPFLNSYLRGIGYDQIVFYSGAKNIGKFVLDDESAVRAINKNKGVKTGGFGNSNSSGNGSRFGSAPQTAGNVTGTNPGDASGGAASGEAPRKKRRILNPRAKAAPTGTTGNVTSTSNSPLNTRAGAATAVTAPVNTSQPDQQTGNQDSISGNTPKNEKRQKLIYKQPKITPVEFLEDAKKMMADTSQKSAVVFTFFQDFFTDRSAPLQPYLELVSHLWDEYSSEKNENICIFLAPQMSNADLNKMFDSMENGFVLKNRFFNENGTINRSNSLEIGLPNLDEIGYALDYLRIIGDGGKRITYRQSERKNIISSIMYLSRESEKDEHRSGYLHAIYNNITAYMRKNSGQVVPITEDVVKRMYSKYKKPDDTDPMEKLKNTKGWESVAGRMEEILKDYKLKKEENEKKNIGTTKVSMPSFANERIDSNLDASGYRYPIPHFVLKGNPGVGKTTVARLIGQIFYNEGILLKGSTIEAKRDDLVDQYVGGTAIKTTECVERAQEGVLFIDDAYSLIDKGDEHNYPKEAIDTLVPIMTNPDKYKFCMIMAGYPDPMDELLKMNSGLRSRFSQANILTIEDYKPDLLQHIFETNCRKDGYRFIGDEEGEEALDLELFFTNLYNQRDRANFGNARDIVAIAKEVKMQCSLRDPVSKCIIYEDYGDFQKYFIKRGVDSIEEIYAQIDSYVGMGFIKDLFKRIRYEVLDNKENIKRGIKPEPYPDHYIFAGNPGTGKTTVGKMIGELYHMLEVLGGAETKFVDASDLIGTHVGDSKNKVVEAMQDAIDHNQVLYIDEAYQISDSAYGNEIIGAMMTKMTENADDFKVIFGMYSNKVEEFLKLNAGLARRLRVVEFPDYTPDQLLEIFDRTIKGQKCTITDEAHEMMRLILTRKYNIRGDDFGNAGEVKKLVVDMRMLRLERTYSSDDPDIDKYQYTIDDIPEDLKKSVEDMVNPKSLDDIMEELNQQIGMSDLKNIIIQKQEEIIFAEKSGGSKDSIRPGYYFFVGNPGTGKSTSAKLFGECLHQLGIVKTDNFHSCTAKDMIAEYVGQTQGKAYELLKKSKNSVLFIDEAYSLSYDGENSSANFKKEALEELIAFMDDPENRRTCCIILAGYEKDMQGLYRSNSGMRSRIEEVHFRDYSAEESYDIFNLFCRKNGYTVSDGVREIYVPIFEELKKSEYFSNGRTARTIFEKTTGKLMRRVVHSPDIKPEDAKVIIVDDLLTYEEAISVVGVEGR